MSEIQTVWKQDKTELSEIITTVARHICPIPKRFGFGQRLKTGLFCLVFGQLSNPNDPTWETKLGLLYIFVKNLMTPL